MNQVNITNLPVWELQVRSVLSKLSSAEGRVAEYVLAEPEAVLGGNIQSIAQASGVSEATVIRFLRRAGFSGLKGFKASMTQANVLEHGRLPASRKLSDSDTTRAIKTKVFCGCMEALGDTLNVLDDGDLARAIDALYSAPYVEVFGIGGSASVARSALHSFRRIGLRMSVTSDPNAAYLRMERFNPGDVVLAISSSGETAAILEAVRIAKEKGAFVISITNVQSSTLSGLSDCRLTSLCRTRMLPGDETYERVAQIAIIHALYAGVAMRQGEKAI